MHTKLKLLVHQSDLHLDRTPEINKTVQMRQEKLSVT